MSGVWRRHKETVGPSKLEVAIQSTTIGNSSGPSDFKRDFLLQSDVSGRANGDCDAKAQVGYMGSHEPKDVGVCSEMVSTGLESAHGESSDEFFLEQAAQEYFRIKLENFIGLFP